MSMEVEAFIFDKKIGDLLLKDGIVYFDTDTGAVVGKEVHYR